MVFEDIMHTAKPFCNSILSRYMSVLSSVLSWIELVVFSLNILQWNSNPEEVLKRIKESTRWSDELDDYELQLGLKVSVTIFFLF